MGNDINSVVLEFLNFLTGKFQETPLLSITSKKNPQKMLQNNFTKILNPEFPTPSIDLDLNVGKAGNNQPLRN